MASQTDKPNLPRDFVLHEYRALSDTLLEARRFAEQGAEEGTVVWALRQHDSKTHSGDAWLASDGDLHCALILRPEFDRETALQLVFVAALSVGAVLSENVSPMTALHYRWPNEILLRQGKAGALRVAGKPTPGGFEWLILGLDLNVEKTPESVSFSAAAVHPDGECEVSCATLLENYCRYFLRTINRWAEDGFSPILNAWLQRVPDIDQYVRLRLEHGAVEGVLKQVTGQGAAVVQTEAGEVVVSLSESFGFR
ncbi:MAG: biotin/lipoate--protein ligase family protein [Gammaproteobacteria bacterium]|nr:biotin/lipoate--protein ligase family protein [Gammaproteobacteria bacterium]